MLKRLLFIALVCMWLVLLFLRPSIDMIGDFQTVIRGSAWMLNGGDVYSDGFVADLKQHWPSIHASSGFPYPLPLALVLAPLAVLPLWLAVTIWLVLGIYGTYAVIWLRPHWRALLPLPLLWIPFWDAVYARQVTLVWFALTVGMLVAMHRKQAWFVGLAIALLPLKPQCGIFFAVYGLVWAWREQRAALGWAAVWAALCWGGSFVVQPTWLGDWVGALGRYGDVNDITPMYIWAIPLLVVTWHLPWPARIAALQVGLFPLISIYTLLPLLLVWIYLRPRYALVGAACSWLYIPLMDMQSAALLCICTLVPFLVCCYLDRRYHVQRNGKPAPVAV